jgi:hypothetical protein
MSQTANLDRVKNNIGVHVRAFVKLRWDTDQKRFAMRELHDYIFQQTQTAPASPDRILRQLRLDGEFDYRVVNRKESLYEITAVGTSTRATNWIKPGKIVIAKPVTVTVNHRSPTYRLLQTCTAVRKQGSNTATLTTFSKSLVIQPGDSLEIIDV